MPAMVEKCKLPLEGWNSKDLRIKAPMTTQSLDGLAIETAIFFMTQIPPGGEFVGMQAIIAKGQERNRK